MPTAPNVTLATDGKTPTIVDDFTVGEPATPTGSYDGAHHTIGAKANAEAGADLTAPWSVISLLKGLLAKLRGVVNVSLTGASVAKATGAGLPAEAVLIAGAEGTNLRALRTSAAGDVVVAGSNGTTPVAVKTDTLPMNNAPSGFVNVIPTVRSNGANTAVTAMASVSALGDGDAGSGTAAAGQYGYIGDNKWDRVRVANVFRPITVTAVGATSEVVLWTPASGRRFRLMGFYLLSSANFGFNVQLRDGAGGNTVVALLLRGGVPESANLGQGRLSIAANNPLVLYNNSGAAWSGALCGIVWGTEE